MVKTTDTIDAGYPRTPLPGLDPEQLTQQWALGSLACNRGLIVLLDAQTAWWKEVERRTVGFMQPWVDPSAMPSAQPLADAANGWLLPTLAGGIPNYWGAWGQLWVNALQHDANSK
jgi:hypothetical protein